MADGYVRQSSYSNGETILAAHTNKEFDQLEKAFDDVIGHTHNGSKGQGGLVPVVSNAAGTTKVVANSTNIEYWVSGVLVMTVTETDVTFSGGVTITGLLNGRNFTADAALIDDLAIVAGSIPISGAEIRTRYIGNSNTEEFTTALKTKLGTIEENATADMSASELKTLVESNSDTQLLTDALKTKLDRMIAEKLEEDPTFFD